MLKMYEYQSKKRKILQVFILGHDGYSNHLRLLRFKFNKMMFKAYVLHAENPFTRLGLSLISSSLWNDSLFRGYMVIWEVLHLIMIK